jgi:hypothetical protein
LDREVAAVPLIDFEEFAGKYAPKIRTRRGRNKWAERNRLPIIQSGRTALINEDAGVARLRELERFQEPPGRRRRKRVLDPVTPEPKRTPGGAASRRRPARTARHRAPELLDA